MQMYDMTTHDKNGTELRIKFSVAEDGIVTIHHVRSSTKGEIAWMDLSIAERAMLLPRFTAYHDETRLLYETETGTLAESRIDSNW